LQLLLVLRHPLSLLTTPESLEAMLISLKVEHEHFFGGVRAIVVDEVHMVTLPLLLRRLQGWPAVGTPQAKTATGKELFSLGRWAVPLNALAVVWGAAMTINLAWPRDAVYNPVGAHHWYLQCFAVTFLILSLAAGALAHWRQRLESRRVLDALDPDLQPAAGLAAAQ
jgi:hypothetical protein